MQTAAAPRMRYPLAHGAYTFPQADLQLQCADFPTPTPTTAAHSHPSSPAAAGGVPSHPAPIALPSLPSLYMPSPASCSPAAQDPFAAALPLDPAFLMPDDALSLPLNLSLDMPYSCFIPTGDDREVYYPFPASGNSSPSLSSSPTTPSSADSSSYSPGGLTPIMSDGEEYDASPGGITPPALPQFSMTRPQQPHQMYIDPQQAYYSYPQFAQGQQPQFAHPQMGLGMPFQQAYPMMQYGYGACVDPTALAGHAVQHAAPQPQQQQQQRAQPQALPTPPRRDRRTQRQRQPDYVPRPPNPFICFRQDWLRRLQRGEIDYHGPRDQRTMSFRISKDWASMSEAEKSKFRKEALQRKRQHAIKYPGYKFAPRQKEKEPSGSEGSGEEDQ